MVGHEAGLKHLSIPNKALRELSRRAPKAQVGSCDKQPSTLHLAESYSSKLKLMSQQRTLVMLALSLVSSEWPQPHTPQLSLQIDCGDATRTQGERDSSQERTRHKHGQARSSSQRPRGAIAAQDQQNMADLCHEHFEPLLVVGLRGPRPVQHEVRRLRQAVLHSKTKSETDTLVSETEPGGTASANTPHERETDNEFGPSAQ